MELWEYWVGRIKDIRAELDEEGTNTVGSVFLRGRLYSPHILYTTGLGQSSVVLQWKGCRGCGQVVVCGPILLLCTYHILKSLQRP